MKKFKLNKIYILALALIFTIGLSGLVMAATAVDLGTAEDFAVLAGSAISDAAPTGAITGDVGLSPAAGTNITGLTGAQVSGTIYAVDATGPDGAGGNNPGLLTTAKTNLSTAYTNAAGQLSDFPLVASTTDSFPVTGYTLEAGVYTSASTIGITGTLTLDGENDPDAVFIFQAGTTLTTATNSQIVLINGAQACNVFWQVGTSATLGTTTDFAGTIMAAASITDNGGADVAGRLLADADNNGAGAVTLSNTDIVVPTCAPSLTLNKVVDNTGGGAALNTAWTLTAIGAGGSPTNLSGTTPVNSNTTFPNATFEADTYTLAESGGPADYDAGTYSCVTNGGGAVVSNSIILGAGDDAVCTITNTYNPPSTSGSSSGSSRRRVVSEPEPELANLSVIKQVINNNGGTLSASAFSLRVRLSGDDVSGSPANGVASPGRSYELEAGTYVVSEDPENGYAQSFSGACDQNGVITLSEGDDLACIVTNDDIGPVVVYSTPLFPASGLPPDGKNLPLVIAVLLSISLLSLSWYQKKTTE